MLTQYKALRIINLCSDPLALIETDAHICFFLHGQIHRVALFKLLAPIQYEPPQTMARGNLILSETDKHGMAQSGAIKILK